MRAGETDTTLVLICDDACIHISGYMYCPNNRQWPVENLTLIHDAHYVVLRLVCTVRPVLCVQLQLLGYPFIWHHKFASIYYTHADAIFGHMSDYNRTYVFLFSKTVQQLTAHVIYALSTECFCDRIISEELWPPHSSDRNTSLGPSPPLTQWVPEFLSGG